MDELLGKSLQVGISDPWEFGEALGWTTLRGKVSHVGRTPTHYDTVYDALIMRLDTPFEYRDQRCEWLHMGARYEGQSVADLASGRSVSCSFSVVPEQRIDANQQFDVEMWERGGIGFIGSAQLDAS